MTTKLNLNQYPHFDDYADGKKYYQILFRPGRAVQARELTQLQTMLQRQIERFGRHIFKNGSNVLPGTETAVRYTPGLTFIKLPLEQVVPAYNSNTTTEEEIHSAITQVWVGNTIATSSVNGDRAGIKGKIIGYRGPDKIGSYGEVRFFLNILSSSNSGQYHTFQGGDVLEILTGGSQGQVTATIPAISAGSDQHKVGTASSVSIEEGVYFYNGYFVYVDTQTIFLTPTILSAGSTDPDAQQYQSKWSDLPSGTVGLSITEQVKTFQDDETLLDNATGTPNYSAPGADRLYISADLLQIPYDTTKEKPSNFIPLLEISKGVIYSMFNTPEYGPIMDTIARRTYDESGDYIVDNMSVQITEFLRDDETKNNGAHSKNEFEFTTRQEAAECAKTKFGVTIAQASIVQVGSVFYPGTSYDEATDPTSFKNLCDGFLTARVDPGKAYVKGYEIRKLAKTNIDIPKSRSYTFSDTATIPTPLGRYLSVKDLAGNITFTKYVQVDLYDRRRTGTQVEETDEDGNKVYSYNFSSSLAAPAAEHKIGTALLVKIDSDSESGDGFYRAYVTNIKMNQGYQLGSVKLIHAAAQGIIAHTVLEPYELSGAVTISSAETPANTAASIVLRGTAATGWYSSPNEILKVNDYVYAEASQELYRVISAPTNDTRLTVQLESGTGTVTTFADSKFSTTHTKLYSSTNESGLIYQLPDSYIKTVRTKSIVSDEPAVTTDMAYTIEQVFDNSGAGLSVTTNSGIYSITINIAAGVSYTFDPNVYAYKVIKNPLSTRTVLPVQSGNQSTTVADDKAIVSIAPGGKQLTFYFSETNAGAAYTYAIIVPVTKAGVLEKKKILRRGSFGEDGTYTHTGITVSNPNAGFKVVSAASNSEIHLGLPDVFRVTRIVSSKNAATIPSNTKTLASGDVDVTALYEFDNGQTEYYYGLGTVYLKPNYPKPTGQVRVEYDYFDHSAGATDGDYFSVDSYIHSDGISYDEIPLFTSKDGVAYSLADCLDFRKPIDAASDGVAPIEFLTCDYFTYSARKDKIILSSKTKLFELNMGTPGLDPEVPEESDSGMTLVELSQMPYGIGKDSCRMKPRDNRRYTMRDIGKLEKRIENLEYYTSLSLLEQETSGLRITDANGNDRFKNGFLVDNFRSFNSSDVNSPDFSCSIDTTTQNVARPLAFSDQFTLVEDLINPTLAPQAQLLRMANLGTQYTKVGDLYMLPFARTEIISQKIATKVMNVNPYNVTSFVGTIILDPWSDTWRETRYSEINVYDDSAYQLAKQMMTGQTDYSKTYKHVTKKIGKPAGTGRIKVLVAGHAMLDTLSSRDRAEAIRAKRVKVPEPYLNAGEWIPVETRGRIQREYRQTGSITTRQIRTSFDSELTKTDVVTTRSLTKDETTDIEFMRSIDVVVYGTSFRRSSNMYPYFDDVPVSAHCRPVDSVDVDLSVSAYSLQDVTVSAAVVGALPSNSPTRYFKVDGVLTTQFPIGVGGVRVGCEVVVDDTSGLRKFDVLRVLKEDATDTNYTIIQVKEKPQPGMLSTDMGAITKVSNGSFKAKVSKYAYGDQIKTADNGSVKFVFRIPNEDGNRFKTGQAKFVLSSSSAQPIPGRGISRGSADFLSKGTLNVQEVTVTQTQQFTVSETSSTSSSTSTQPTEIYGLWQPEVYDPLAQTFRVRETGGCYITDVDVFFAKKPTAVSIDVRLELRTCSLSGQPEASIVGGALGIVVKHTDEVVVNEVTLQDPTASTSNNTLEIKVDSETSASTVGGYKNTTTGIIEWNQSTEVRSDSLKDSSKVSLVCNTPFISSNMSADMVPTRFTFKSPIYLEENKQYCFVVLSDSDEYEVWTAEKARDDVRSVKIGTTESVTQEPFTDGHLYKSKSGISWVEEEYTTMKFNLSKATFKTRVDPSINVGEISYVNETIPWTHIVDSGIEIRPGSNLLRVFSMNHGVSVNDRVCFTFDDSDSGSAATLKGFAKSDLQSINGLLVKKVELDFFTVEVSGSTASNSLTKEQRRLGTYRTNADGSKTPTAYMRINKKFEQVVLTANAFTPPGTSVSWTIETTPTNGLNEYNSDGTSISRNPGNDRTNPIIIIPGTPAEFTKPMALLAPENERVPGAGSGITNLRDIIKYSKSVIIKAKLISDNSNLSPVIDASRLAVTTISTRLDNPIGIAAGVVGNVINQSVFDDIIVFSDNAPVENTTPALTGVATNTELTISTAQKVLAGTFSQDSVTSGILLGTGTTLKGNVYPGDTISANGQERIVDKVVSNTKLIVDSPFNPQLAAGTKLSLANEPMEITTTHSGVAAHLSQLDVGKYVTLTTDDAEDAGIVFTDKLVLGVEYTPDTAAGETKCKITVDHLNNTTKTTYTGAVTLVQKDRFIDETAYSGGSAGSKYICRKLSLDRTSNALKISFDAIRDEYSQIDLYYRTEGPNDVVGIDDKNWKKAIYNIDVDGVLTVKSPEPSDAEYREYASTNERLTGFTAVQAKVVFRGGNPAKPPKIKNFRLIALDE